MFVEGLGGLVDDGQDLQRVKVNLKGKKLQ